MKQLSFLNIFFAFVMHSFVPTATVHGQDLKEVNQADELNEAGLRFYREGKLEEAIEAYEKGIKIDPNYSLLYYNRGLVLVKMNKQDKAIDDFKTFIMQKPESHDGYIKLGRTLLEQNRYDEAVAAFSDGLKNCKKEFRPGMSDSGGTPGSLSEVRVLGAWTVILWNRAEAYRIGGKLKEAFEDYNEYIRVQPKDPDGFIGRAKTLRLMADRDYDKAIQLFRSNK